MSGQQATSEELVIAIIGMAGRFPGAGGVEEFWRNLVAGVESIDVLSEDELRAAGVSEEALADPGYVRAAARIAGVELFDANFFGYSPREAAYIDPQQRLLLETSWEALEDAGYDPASGRAAVGVFAAASTSTYLLNNLHATLDPGEFLLSSDNLRAVLGNGGDFPATRISYKLNLTGPSVTVQTACSSSLVAVHMACQSLLSGECDMALAGGASIYLPQNQGYRFQEDLILSPDGHCRVFDADAGGTVFGRGVGIVVLKPLDAARRDGDHIYATILGSAINNDGASKAGFTAPSVTGQAAVIAEAMANAGVGPDTVGYVEAHGTGTKQGDPIEIAGLTQAYREGTKRSGYCAIGSVKANIGHLDCASGVAGLIKAALTLDKGQIPATLHFKRNNPEIDFAATPFVVNAGLTPWPRGSQARRAAVSSFGMGGTNAHVVLEEAPAKSRSAEKSERPMHLLTLSAKSERALHELAGRYATYVAEHLEVSLADLCFTASTGRARFPHRLALRAASPAELRVGLQWAAAGERSDLLLRGTAASSSSDLVYLFTGQGSQYVGMGRELYETEAVFRRTLEECSELVRPHLERPLLEVMFSGGALLEQTAYTQPALFALEYSLYQMLASWGLKPAAVLGHSVGEYVAACVANVFGLEDALRLIAARGRLMQPLPAGGAMAALLAGEEEVLEAIAEWGEGLSIAALNGPRNTVISGDLEAVEAVVAKLAGAGVEGHRLAVSHAFHSARMEPMLEEFERIAETIEYRPPTLVWASNADGGLVRADEVCGAAYWRRQIRQPVRFAAGVEALLGQGYRTFVELGPHPVLMGMASQGMSAANAEAADASWIGTLRRGRSAWPEMMAALGALYIRGAAIDWEAFHGYSRHNRIALPTYPFQRERLWMDAPPRSKATPGPARDEAGTGHPLLGRSLLSPRSTDVVHEVVLTAQTPAYLQDHRIAGVVVFPATAYMEAVRAALAELSEGDCRIEEMTIEDALVFPEAGARVLQLLLSPIAGDGDAYEFEFYSREGGDERKPEWTLHASGRVRAVPGDTTEAAGQPDMAQCAWRDATEFYANIAAAGLAYGPVFRGIARVRAQEGASEVEIRPERRENAAAYWLAPAVFDAGLQAVLACLPREANARGTLPLPVGFRQVRFHGPARELKTARARVWRDGNSFAADVRLLDDAGRVLVGIDGLTLRPMRADGLGKSRAQSLEGFLYRTAWEAKGLGSEEGRAAVSALELSLAQVQQQAGGRWKELSELHALAVYDELGPALDRLSGQYAVAAIRELGWELVEGGRRRADTLADELKVVAAHRRMFERTLEMLAEDGVTAREGRFWVVKSAPQAVDTAGEARRMLEQWPMCAAEITMTARCGAELAAVLGGRRDPIELLFPAGSLRDLEAIYHRAPFARAYNGMVAGFVADMAAQLPASRRLRILEIGAGTGGTTASVLPALPADRTGYTYTDVSPLFLARAEERFAEFSFLRYRLLDIDNDPQEQGFGGEQFDLVIASNVLHATVDLRKTMLRVAGLTAPGGLMVMIEGTSKQRWVDLIFGQTEGWWRATDSALRTGYPLISEQQWRAMLPEVGFPEVMTLPHNRASETVFEQMVLAAKRAHAPAQERPYWLLFADNGGLAEGIAAMLEGAGHECVLVRAGHGFTRLNNGEYTLAADREEEYAALLREMGGRTVAGVVHLWSLDHAFVDAGGLSAQDIHAAQETGCRSVLNLVKALAAWDGERMPRLWLVTRGTQDAGDGAVNAANATLLGLARVIALEFPELLCTRVDLAAAPAPREAQQLFEELWAADGEREIAYRGGERRLRRLEHLPASETAQPVRRLAQERPGDLESLEFQPWERRRPGPAEVEIEVWATGLNFRDVLVALGIYPDSEVSFGGECAGVVTAVGAGVSALRVGEAVLAMAADSFATHTVVAASLVAAKPERMSWEEGAGIPGAFLTAHYALHMLAGMRAGDTVLIHSATGGVGLAAVQLAQKAGATVFATAGTEEKRSYLRSIGVHQVMDSRTRQFAEQVLEATEGRGVDVVLNSLAGDRVEASIRALTRSGRFVEMGKRDIWSDARFHAVHPAAQYFVIDVAAECGSEPEKFGQALRDLVAKFATGELTPLPRRVFGWTQVGAAFRLLSRAGHIGKIIVTQRPDAWRTKTGTELVLRRDGSYLVTGGLGGLGLLLAEWMVEHGARHVVLMGRHAPSPAAQKAIDRLTAQGALVESVRGDVSVAADVAEVVAKLPSLRGVVHAAGALDDGALHRQEWSRFEKVMAAKVYGALHLHRLTARLPLDFFVLFSSAASMLGSPGQSNHAAANAFLDALAHLRRSAGMPGSAINWGVWTEVGAAAERKVASRMPVAGLQAISPQQGLALFARLLEGGEVQAGAFRMDWKAYAGTAGRGPEAERLARAKQSDRQKESDGAVQNDGARQAAQKGEAPAGGAGLNSLERIRQAPASQQKSLLARLVEERVVKALGFDPSRPPDRSRPLHELGLDSLLAVELRNLLSNDLHLPRRLPATLLFDYPSVTAIASYLAGELLPAETSAQLAGMRGADADVDEIAGLSDEEAEAMLLDELNEN